ncbi:MAG: hypothetical protein GAK45_02231 [Pseudomonas citronellolis]|nr:MAG: hypothetical protein GAK45_02231 [Pseudomonas citronellolis]
MKRFLLYLGLVLPALLSQSAMAGDSFRCGSALVNVGDRAFEVQHKCGEPQYRDPVGYTLQGYDRREYRVEEWAYGPINGATYILTFEGNRLTRIEFKRD